LWGGGGGGKGPPSTQPSYGGKKKKISVNPRPYAKEVEKNRVLLSEKGKEGEEENI